ncbi:F-box family protein with DUF295, partial [Prunus dulcis]
RPFDFQAAARPPQAEPISAVGTCGSASVWPSQPDQPPPQGRPELAEKSCFPTEVRSKLPEFPARNFLRFSTKSIEHQRSSPSAGRTFKRAKLARTICRRSAQDPPPGHS